MTSRRNFSLLTLTSTAYTLLKYQSAIADTSTIGSDLGSGISSEVSSIIASAAKLGIGSEAAAPSGETLHSISGTLAEIITKLIQKKTEKSAELADQAGYLLAEINRATRDAEVEDFAAAAPSFEAVKADYRKKFTEATVRQEKLHELVRAAEFIVGSAAKPIYQDVERRTGVPWYVIGALHYREASLNFMGHLHNGDFLRLKTVHVPAHRPNGVWPPIPWHTPSPWISSAIDALGVLSRVKKWSVERMLYTFESYNGWGYRSRGTQFVTPYLWNYSQFYKGGGYPRDRVFMAEYQSKQAGLVAVLKTIASKDPTLRFKFDDGST